MKITITRDGDPVFEKEGLSLMDALKEYRRMKKNIRRRRKTYNYVEFPLEHRMSWYQDGVHYYLQMEKEK